MTLYDSRGTHLVIKCTRPSALPMKILPRVIITYGACARGGGRRPGFETTTALQRIGAVHACAIADFVA